MPKVNSSIVEPKISPSKFERDIDKDVIKRLSKRERNSIINKNILEFKIAAIYSELTNLPQIPFKKIDETDYLYGSIRVSIISDSKNNNLHGIFQINFFSFLD